jgi:hypothetical protein
MELRYFDIFSKYTNFMAIRPVQWEPSCSMRTDGRRDKTKLIVVLRNFATTPTHHLRQSNTCPRSLHLPQNVRLAYLSLSRTTSFQSMTSKTCFRRSIRMSDHLRLDLSNGFWNSGFHTNTQYPFLFSSIRATCPAPSLRPCFYHPNMVWSALQTTKLLTARISPASRCNHLLRPNMFLRSPRNPSKS